MNITSRDIVLLAYVNTNPAAKARSNQLILWLVASVTVAGIGLFAWYAF